MSDKKTDGWVDLKEQVMGLLPVNNLDLFAVCEKIDKKFEELNKRIEKLEKTAITVGRGEDRRVPGTSYGVKVVPLEKDQ
jgi:hypothetical protein